MEFVKAQKFTARLSERYYLNDSETYLFLKFELTYPDRIFFAAGQYISLKVSDLGERRSYSIVSTPDMNHAFELVAEILPQGKGSDYLKNLKPGDTVEVLGPLGRFVVDDHSPQRVGQIASKLLFVATGSGIAPVTSMITDLLITKRDNRPMRLTWGMRNEAHIFWFDNFERLAEEHPNFVFDPVLSQPNSDWPLCTGHVQDCITRDFTQDTLNNWDLYVCGNPTMVEQVVELAHHMKLPDHLIHHEKFS